MRFSVISLQVLSSAALASAAAVPNKPAEDILLGLPLGDYGHFHTAPLEEADEALRNATQFGTTPAPTDEDDDLVFTTAAAPGGPCANPSIRVEWRNMRNEDRHGFLNGVKCLMDKPASGKWPGAKNRYEDIVAIHQRLTPNIHQSGLFLPWHRYYAWVFMRTMRQECGYRGPYPWWDESKDAGRFARSPLFTAEYFGSLPGPNNGRATCITSGAFGGRTLNIGPNNANTPHCLARAVDESQTTYTGQGYVDSCNSRGTYSDMAGCNELGPHGFGHNGIGGVMADVAAAPGDPIFFLHHGFVDRMWRKWQIKQDSRLRQISGCATPGSNCQALTLNTKLNSMGLKEERTVGDMLDIYNNLLCYLYDY